MTKENLSDKRKDSYSVEDLKEGLYRGIDLKHHIQALEKELKTGCGKKVQGEICGSDVDCGERSYDIRCSECIRFEKKVDELFKKHIGEKLRE